MVRLELRLVLLAGTRVVWSVIFTAMPKLSCLTINSKEDGINARGSDCTRNSHAIFDPATVGAKVKGYRLRLAVRC